MSHSKTFFVYSVLVGLCFFFIPVTPAHALTPLTTCAELQDINLDLAEDYVLANDVDCTGFTFTPIGTFTGTLDGDGYAIDNLTIVGLVNGHAIFTATSGATIKHLAITNASVMGNYETAILSAVATDTTFLDVSIEGTLFSGATLSLAGSFAGRMSGGRIVHGSADVAITGYEFVGGLVGSATDGALIKKSYATGTITTTITSGNSSNGGLVGELIDSYVHNSYSDIAISAHGNNIGGLVGISQGDSTVYYSYAVGSVASTGTANIGGLIGEQIDNAETGQSYWNIDTTLQATSAAGEGKTTSEMKDEDTFELWDFTHIWNITSNNYPDFVPYNPALPTLTEVRRVPSRVTEADAKYYFEASEDGEYLFSYCGATISVNAGLGIVYFSDLQVGGVYTGCQFQYEDDDGNISNGLTINEFTVISDSTSRQSRSRAATVAIYNLNRGITSPDTLFTRTLRLGSVGTEVKALQQFLNTYGFPIATVGKGSLGNETTIFGPKTMQALVKFQNAHADEILSPLGLKSGTGIFGNNTRELINSLS